MKILSVQEMIEAEKAADASGHSYATMMELAGTALAELVLDRAEVHMRPIVILVGSGNNGGDGLVASRFLREAGASVTIFLARPRFLYSDRDYQQLLDMGIELIEPVGRDIPELFEQRLAECGIIIDALLGTGISRPLSGLIYILLSAIKTAVAQDNTKMVVAADCPSGMNCDTGKISDACVNANVTVSFGAMKIGHTLFPATDYIGELIVADIGIDPLILAKAKTELATAELMRQFIPSRQHNGHKGTFGKILVAGGCDYYQGAPLLSGLAAFRTGSGLVSVLTPEVARQVVMNQLPEAIVPPVRDASRLNLLAVEWLKTNLSNYRAILLGPGLGEQSKTFIEEALKCLRDARTLAVLDADALNEIAKQPSLLASLPNNVILTPHVGEMARLMDLPIAKLQKFNRIELASAQANLWNCVLFLKGANSVIAAPDGRVTVLPFANPLLSVAGSGDVLGGIIVSLLGQGLDPFDAAVLGGWLHGAAGELGAETYGDRGMLASELANLIPIVIRSLLENSLS